MSSLECKYNKVRSNGDDHQKEAIVMKMDHFVISKSLKFNIHIMSIIM